MLNLRLVPVGKTDLTVGLLLYIIIMLWIVITTSKSFKEKVLEPILAKTNLDTHVQSAVGLISHYAMVAVGAIIVLNTAGIDLTSLTVVVGALGLGLSLGLQTVAKNMAGGFMILYEKPIRIGDRVQISDTVGSVTRIALRATTIRTDDGTDITVPNADFMSNKIINWTSPPKDFRISVPVTVNGIPEIEDVKSALLKLALENPLVLPDPAPEVLLDSFEDSKVKFILRASTKDYSAATGGLKSALNYAIYPAIAKLRDARIKELVKEDIAEEEEHRKALLKQADTSGSAEASAVPLSDDKISEVWHNKFEKPPGESR